MKIRFIPKNNIVEDPIVRLRCGMIIEALQKEGYDIDFYTEEDTTDILVLASTNFSKWLPIIKKQKDKGSRIIFDLSENEFKRSSKVTYRKLKGIFRYIHNPLKVLNRFQAHNNRKIFDSHLVETIKIADYVTVSSEDIMDSVVSINKNVSVIYEPLENGYPKAPKRHCNLAQSIVWVGMPNSINMLMSIKSSLTNIINHNKVDLKVISSPAIYEYYPKLHRHIPFRINFKEWNLETLWDEIAECDIGIAPLHDYDWKSPNKPVTYWAAGLPAVTSPSRVYSRLISPGQTGFIASNTKEWKFYLKRLIEEPELRNRIGENGYKKAINNFNIKAISKQWMSTFQNCFQKF